jgi:hypothetical protein
MDITAKIEELAQGSHGFRSRKNYSKKSAAIT